MKIHIYGSCVSRDIVDFDKSNELDVVSYNGRSSFATLTPENLSKKIQSEYYDSLKSIDSPFQRRMVDFDFNNNILESINSSNYDVLLIDLIDNRFNLGKVNDKLVTISPAFALSNIKASHFINMHSSQFLEEWYKGVDNFFHIVDKTVGFEGILINKVYWADTATDPLATLDINNRWEIEKNNDRLDVFYNYLEKILPKTNIIEAPKELFTANPSHQWGLAPFHYIDEYYAWMIDKIK